MLLGIAFLYGASEKGTFFIDELAIGKANCFATVYCRPNFY